MNVPTGNDFVAIAAGGFHNVALKADGSLVAWGFPNQGITNVPVGNDFVRITSGAYHNLAAKADGSLVGWGSDGEYQTYHVPTGKAYFAIAEGGGTVWRFKGSPSQRPPCLSQSPG